MSLALSAILVRSKPSAAIPLALEDNPIQGSLDYGDATSCEAEFEKLSEAARALILISKELLVESKKLEAASASGDLTALKKIRTAISSVAKKASEASETISGFDTERISAAIGSRQFLSEVVEAADSVGITTARLFTGGVVAFPARLSVDEKGVKIGRKPVSSVRPTALAALLKVELAKARPVPPGFLDGLCNAYDVVARQAAMGASPAVPLSDVYEILTLLPEVRKGYLESDFIRDLSMVDAYGPHKATDGRKLALVASTSTRMGRGYRSMTPEGIEQTYYSIRFVSES